MFLHVVGQPVAGVVKLEAVTAYLERHLRELIPPEAGPWCYMKCLVEFGSQCASPAERILKVARFTATDLIVLGVRSMNGKLGVVTHLGSTTAQLVAHAECPMLTVRR